MVATMLKDPRGAFKDKADLDGPVTTLIVGEEHQAYAVHTNLLTKSSPYFVAATKKEWQESGEQRILLPEDDPDTVELYIQWLYRGKVFNRQGPEETIVYRAMYHLLISAFIWAEKIQDGNFKDAIIDTLIVEVSERDHNGQSWYPAGRQVSRAYQGTLQGSPLRELLLDMYLIHGEASWLNKGQSEEFMVDLSGRFMEVRDDAYEVEEPSVQDNRSCRYHHHGEEKPCYSAA